MKVNKRFMTTEEVRNDIFSSRIYLVHLISADRLEMRKTNTMTIKELYQALNDSRSTFVEISEEEDNEKEEQR